MKPYEFASGEVYGAEDRATPPLPPPLPTGVAFRLRAQRARTDISWADRPRVQKLWLLDADAAKERRS